MNAPPLHARVGEDLEEGMLQAASVAANARLFVSGDEHLLRVLG